MSEELQTLKAAYEQQQSLLAAAQQQQATLQRQAQSLQQEADQLRVEARKAGQHSNLQQQFQEVRALSASLDSTADAHILKCGSPASTVQQHELSEERPAPEAAFRSAPGWQAPEHTLV